MSVFVWRRPQQILMDIGLTCLEQNPWDGWAMLKTVDPEDVDAAGFTMFETVLPQKQKKVSDREIWWCTRENFRSMLDEVTFARDHKSGPRQALTELFDLAGWNPNDRAAGIDPERMAENDLFWPLAYWQLLAAERQLPSEHRQQIAGAYHGDCERVTRPLEWLTGKNPWLAGDLDSLRQIWFREIETRILYLAQSDHAVLWRLRPVGHFLGGEPRGIARGQRLHMVASGRHRATFETEEKDEPQLRLGFADWELTERKIEDSEVAFTVMRLRHLVPQPLDPWNWLGEAAPPRLPAGPPPPRELPAHTRETAWDLPGSPAPYYGGMAARPPRLLAPHGVFTEKDRANWPAAIESGYERLEAFGVPRTRTRRAIVAHREERHPRLREGYDYNPRLSSSFAPGERPAITREIRRRLQPLIDEITRLRPAVLEAYQKAERTHRKADYARAADFDAALDRHEQDLDQALDQLTSEGDVLDPHLGGPTQLHEQTGEGEEPMGFGETPERELQHLYAGWLFQRSRPPRSPLLGGYGPFYAPEEATEEALAHAVRLALEAHGPLRPDVTPAELVEIARDAYEAAAARRRRAGPVAAGRGAR